MGKVVINVSVSLDGFVSGRDPRVDEPLGDEGPRLHEWLMGDDRDPIDAAVGGSRFSTDVMGAVVMGRTTFDGGIGPWGDDGTFRTPCFVVTHRPAEPVVKGPTTFTFVTDGADAALSLAVEAAAGRDVNVMGSDLGVQLLRAGLVDEVFVTMVPVLLGAGAPLFRADDGTVIELERTAVVVTPHVTHVAHRVVRSGG